MVCSVAKVTQGNQGYYTRIGRDDYYATQVEIPGRFLGSGAEELGLHEAIYHKDARLSALFEGLHPFDRTPLRSGATTQRTYRTNDGQQKVHKPVCAYDFTLSAPKSVSVLWALSDRETQQKIENCHDRAVRAVARYLEEQVSFTRIGAGGVTREKVKPIFAAFQHSTSRELDPQLHTHLLFLNTVIRADGRGGALDGRELFKCVFLAGEIYRETLRSGLSKELPVQMVDITLKKGRSFEIEGVPVALCKDFSKRRGQIEKFLTENDTPKQVQTQVLKTRRKKLHEVSREQLFKVWQKVGREYGFDASKLLEEGRKRQEKTQQGKKQEQVFPGHVRSNSRTETAYPVFYHKIRERYLRWRDRSCKNIDRRFEAAKKKTATARKRYERKMLFLYATGKISRSRYLQLAYGKGLPRTKLGIHLAYGTYKISRKQHQFLLRKYGYLQSREPVTRTGINWAYATHRISEGTRLYLLSKYGHLQHQAPHEPSHSQQRWSEPKPPEPPRQRQHTC